MGEKRCCRIVYTVRCFVRDFYRNRHPVSTDFDEEHCQFDKAFPRARIKFNCVYREDG
jgi:hypothetical protein